MGKMRKIEIFSAGCALCDDTLKLVNSIAGPAREISVLDTHDRAVAARAKKLGVRSVPAVVIDGKLASCCTRGGPDEATLRAELT